LEGRSGSVIAHLHKCAIALCQRRQPDAAKARGLLSAGFRPLVKTRTSFFAPPCPGAFSEILPLKGLKLTKLAIHYTSVSDLSPLEEMPLASLQMSNTRVSDLTPLKGAPLTWLSCVNSPVKDLAPLAGAPLATLWCGGSQVTDFSPLKAAPLKELSCDFQPERDKEALWAIKSLESINGKPAADF